MASEVPLQIEVGTQQSGWKCPGCGACYAPWMYKCSDCPPATASNDTLTGTGTSWPVCTLHARMYPPGGYCPMCAGEVTG